MKNGKLELTVYLNEPWLRGYITRSSKGWQWAKKQLRQHIREAVDETGLKLDIIVGDEVCDPNDILVTTFHDSKGEIVADGLAKSKYGVRAASGLRRRVAATVNDFILKL
jgi:hypothetical protein